jgi:hypothetical protein
VNTGFTAPSNALEIVRGPWGGHSALVTAHVRPRGVRVAA